MPTIFWRSTSDLQWLLHLNVGADDRDATDVPPHKEVGINNRSETDDRQVSDRKGGQNRRENDPEQADRFEDIHSNLHVEPSAFLITTQARQIRAQKRSGVRPQHSLRTETLDPLGCERDALFQVHLFLQRETGTSAEYRRLGLSVRTLEKGFERSRELS